MRYRKRKTGCFLFFLAAAVCVSVFRFGPDVLERLSAKVTGTGAGSGFAFMSANASGSAGESVSVDPGSLCSPCAVLVRLDDGAVLMQKESDRKIYPASLTKIMTAVVAIENLSDLKAKIELPASLFRPLYKENASMAGFQPGEKVRTVDLLYGALLPSGAECCEGLANAVSGSEGKFADRMNRKAEELGMRNTHFMNATGLQNKEHYTTVGDLSVLLRYALQNDTFRDIFTSSRYSTAPTNKHPDGITFRSTMFQNLEDPALPGGKILGGKTGYTDEAGLCLASLAKVGGTEYILVTAGAQGDHNTRQYDIEDARAVYKEIGKE